MNGGKGEKYDVINWDKETKTIYVLRNIEEHSCNCYF